MIDIYLYKFTKKARSTKLPSGGQLFQCTIREPSGVVNPFIRLQLNSEAYPDYNYAYIPKFNRYYWISEWVYTVGSVWEGSLNVDSLASWRSYIGNKEMYVLRSSARYDGRVVDNMYPMKAKPSSYIDRERTVTISNRSGTTSYDIAGYWSRSPQAGAYYLGVVGNNATGVTCYVFNYDGFKAVLQKLTEFEPSDMPDVSEGVSKALADPMQYIVFCYWLPFLPVNKQILSASLTINFGYYPVTITGSADEPVGAEIDPVADMVKSSMSFSIRKHPQAVSRGAYLNQSPFSHYRVSLLPFGVFDLDASMMIDDRTVTAEWWTDFMTGAAELSIYATNTLMTKIKAQFGVPINISQAVVDYINAGMSIGTGFGGAIGQAISGDLFGAIANGLSAVGSAASALQPKISQLGGGGDFLPFCNDPPAILTDFYEIVDEYNRDLGRPLCTAVTPEELGGGYIQALDGELEAPATQRELNEISGYLTGGFFYE